MIYDIIIGLIICLLFICLIVLFCVILIKLYIQKIKKYNDQILQNQIDFQKTLNSSIIESQEELLNAISLDLHDDAGQQLSVINFQLENLKIDNPYFENKLIPISESVAKLAHSLRQISHSLNNNWLLENGLVEAIQHEVKRLENNKNITVILKSTKNKKIKDERQIVLFRIFQETMNNILKHANANIITISIVNYPLFSITIEDNGCGFDLEEMNEKTNSIGLKNCVKRAQMIDFTYTIHSQKNSGTKILLQENKNH